MNSPIFGVIATLLLIGGCGAGAAYRYRQVAEGYGLHRALHHAFVRDGESVELQVSDEAGRPLEGLALIIDAESGPIRLVSDANGRLAFPVSSRLLRANPAIRMKRPPAAGRFDMQLVVRLRDACERGTRPVIRPLARDFERWPFRDFGPDRVYAESGVAADAAQMAGDHLTHARALFLELTGAQPPAIGVALSKVDGAATGARDRAGRTIWPLSETSLVKQRGLPGVVHEWTHAVMHELLPGVHDARSRYVEDGLCDLMSHLTYERAHGARGSPLAASHADALAEFADHPSFDLLELGQRFSTANDVTMFDQVARLCADRQVTIGYGLGLAFWLEQLDHNPDVLGQLFAQLRRAERPGAQVLIAASDELSQPTGALRAMDVARALQTLRRHGAGR